MMNVSLAVFGLRDIANPNVNCNHGNPRVWHELRALTSIVTS